jgi:hypothetical protein
MDRRGIVVASLLFCAVGCVPLPIPHQRLPRADGVLIDQGKPLAGVDVGYAWGRGDCASEVVQKTVTGPDGHFAFEGDRSPVVMISLLPMTVNGWHVCFDKGAYWYGEWAVTVSPQEIHLQCDMRARPVCAVERKD